jgi:hypothetical protein
MFPKYRSYSNLIALCRSNEGQLERYKDLQLEIVDVNLVLDICKEGYSRRL